MKKKLNCKRGERELSCDVGSEEQKRSYNRYLNKNF